MGRGLRLVWAKRNDYAPLGGVAKSEYTRFASKNPPKEHIILRPSLDSLVGFWLY